jgi:SAM-dependent methyltransferase
MKSPTTRFSDRAADYQRFRPGYPDELFDALGRLLPPLLARDAADIGSGTGIFTEGLLRRGWRVAAVEPNAAMRAVAEQRLGAEPQFRSVARTAEDTGLDDASVSLVTAAQAFHWFDADACATEWRRLLRPGGLAALTWNERDIAASAFMAGYEALLREHGDDYDAIAHRRWDTGVFAGLFGETGYDACTFATRQHFDLAGLHGRSLSASYCPAHGEPGHQPFLDDLGRLFERHQNSGVVTFVYATRLFTGSLDRA